MAKRPSRSQADDLPAAERPAKAKGRAKAQRELGSAAVANREPDPMKPNTIASGPETISERLEGSADRVQQSPGDPMAVRRDQRMTTAQPTDEDIRARAYQMYLERGGHHGLDFDDWVRAEQELKHRR